MYEMQKLNVVRIVATEEEMSELKDKGFEEVGKVQPDYNSMTVDDLKTLAKEKEVSGYSSMKKDEIIAVLKALESENK